MHFDMRIHVKKFWFLENEVVKRRGIQKGLLFAGQLMQWFLFDCAESVL